MQEFYREEIPVPGSLQAPLWYLACRREALNKSALSLVSNDTQLRMSKLGEEAGVAGGCLMARSRLLSLI